MTSLPHTLRSAHAAGNWVAFVVVFPCDTVCFMNSMFYVHYLANEMTEILVDNIFNRFQQKYV